MGMLNWLTGTTDRQKRIAAHDRIKHLEACNATLAAALAERDATARSLEETTASLIDAKRSHGKLNEEFDRLAAMFREKVDELAAAMEANRLVNQIMSEQIARLYHLDNELHAAEQLLDEAGESIRVWRNATFSLAAKLVVEKHCR